MYVPPTKNLQPKRRFHATLLVLAANIIARVYACKCMFDFHFPNKNKILNIAINKHTYRFYSVTSESVK